MRGRFVSIKYRFLKLFLSLVIPVVIFISIVYYVSSKNSLYENFILFQKQTEVSINRGLEHTWSFNNSIDSEWLEDLIEINPYIEALQVSIIEPSSEDLNRSRTLYSYGNIKKYDEVKVIDLNLSQIETGAVKIVYNREVLIEGLIESATLALFMILISATLITIIILGSVETLIKPMYQLNNTVRSFLKGSWFKVLRVDNNDEIGELTLSFNKMAEHIRKLLLNLKRVNRSYERFVPKEFIKLLHQESVTDVKLGDSFEREMSVLFADIRNFTTLSEGMTPKENFEFVNSYLGSVVPSIHNHNGVIDKYIGDAVMAIFLKVDDSIACAVEMIKSSRNISIDIGVGINSGSLMLGVVGAEDRLDTTVISDSVNLASRLESLTRLYGVSMLISEYTYNRIENLDRVKSREIDRVKVKGKNRPTTIYEIYSSDSDKQIALKDKTTLLFHSGLQHFRVGDRDSAIEMFIAILEINPEDSVAKVYLNRCSLSR